MLISRRVLAWGVVLFPLDLGLLIRDFFFRMETIMLKSTLEDESPDHKVITLRDGRDKLHPKLTLYA